MPDHAQEPGGCSLSRVRSSAVPGAVVFALVLASCAPAHAPGAQTSAKGSPEHAPSVGPDCDPGEGVACEEAGDQRASAGDFAGANADYAVACDAGRALACNHLAFDFNTGLGTSQSHKRAFELFTRSCDLGDGRGCASLAALLAGTAGADASTPRDLTRATALAQTWCAKDAALACDVYGRILWLGHDPRAVELWDQACAAGPRDPEGYQGCTHLAGALLDGENVPADVPRAIDLLVKACDVDAPAACNLLGWTYWNEKHLPRDVAKAVQYFRRACNAGDPYGCSNLASRYARGEGVVEDVAKARTLFTWSCERGVKVACDNVRELDDAP